MVVGLLVALAAGVAVCHSAQKKKRMEAYKAAYGCEKGQLTKQEWKQLCREHKQARKTEKHLRKAERHLRRAEGRGCCGKRSCATGPPVTQIGAMPADAMGHGFVDEKHMHDNVFSANIGGEGQREIPVMAADEPPAYQTALKEKM